MRYAPEHNEETRDRILDAASRLFREQGIDSVGLAKVMAEAGLTIGAFYTHFKSKEALLQEALLRSMKAREDEIQRDLLAGNLERAVQAYLSPEHRDHAGGGCPAATLASEVARRPRTTRKALACNLAPTLKALAICLSKRRGTTVSEAEAAAFFGLLVGTLQLARASPDRESSDALLTAGVHAALRLAQ